MDTDDSSLNNADARLPDEVSQDSDTPRDRAEYAAVWRLLGRADAVTDEAFSAGEAWRHMAQQVDAEPSSGLSDDAPGNTRRDTAASPNRSDRRASGRAPVRRSNRSKQSERSIRRNWVAGALLAACLLVGAVFWWSRPVTIETMAGEQTTVSLPDGSTVDLNGATRLTYARGFSVLPFVDAETRTVTLRGEAFFTVASADRPFEIETANARIGVLGTTFNAQAYTTQNHPTTEVTLTSGRVQLRSEAPGYDPVILDRAGQYSRVVGTGAAPSAPTDTPTETAAAWRDGGFAVRNASLPVILRAIEAQFGLPIHLRVPESDTDAMTLHYGQVSDPESILRDIVAVQGLQYRALSQGYELVAPDSTHPESE
ncbi:MAG: FecR domain-containing protein [Longimonas sp.]|uniref:FecR family protein n=1 Tax=Longimonas sp. TaxID=2039626 RepID=UPI003360D8D8